MEIDVTRIRRHQIEMLVTSVKGKSSRIMKHNKVTAMSRQSDSFDMLINRIAYDYLGLNDYNKSHGVCLNRWPGSEGNSSGVGEHRATRRNQCDAHLQGSRHHASVAARTPQHYVSMAGCL